MKFIFKVVLVILSVSYAVKCDEEICSSIPCVLSSAAIVKKQNPNVEPCDDFYEYACGLFGREVRTPDEKSTVDTNSIIKDNNYEYLLSLLSDNEKHNDKDLHKIARNFYESCMDTGDEIETKETINNQKRNAMIEILRQIGGWPVIEGAVWDEKLWEWEDSILRLRKIVAKRTDNIFSGELGINEIDHSNRLDGDPEDFAKIESATKDLMKNLAILFGANDDELLHKDIETLIGFEKELGEHLIKRKLFKKKPKKSYSKNLGELHNRILWIDLMSKYSFGDPQKEISNVPADANRDYYNFLVATPNRTLANFVGWRLMNTAINFLGDDAQKHFFEYQHNAFGTQDVNQRWKTCLDLTVQKVSVGTGSLYIEEYFSEEDRKAAEKMVDYIHAEYMQTLNSSEWIDQDVKIKALDVASNIFKVIGYHDKLRSPEALTYYDSLEKWPKENFLQMGLALVIFDVDREYQRITKKSKEPDWTKYSIPATVNAFYNAKDNSIQFPAAILQRPVFDRLRPAVLNFASIGSIIGHEITHAFDSFVLNSANWSEKSRKLYEDKVNCVVDHVSSYRVPEIEKYFKLKEPFYLRGNSTKREDIADLGGIKLSYNAFQRYRKESNTNINQKLIGFKDYSPEQLFFINFAHYFCTVERPEKMKNLAENDEHTLARYRVLATLSNLHEFAVAWNCTINSPMNPTKKCSVW